MPENILIPIAAALCGCFCLYRSFVSLYRLKFIRASFYTIGSLLAIVTIFLSVFNQSYAQLLDGEEIAQIRFKQISPQVFEAHLSGERIQKIFVLHGDQWQADARIIQVNMRNVQPFYRLERIQGRFVSIKQAKQQAHTVYKLYDKQGEYVWTVLKQLQFSQLFRPQYGSSTFMPMVDGAAFSIALTINGLKSSPINQQARESLELW